MKVFISWSGQRSKDVAELLRNYLPTIVQTVTPFLSFDDIELGELWDKRINKELKEVEVTLTRATP
jgi:hypothetical protein